MIVTGVHFELWYDWRCSELRSSVFVWASYSEVRGYRDTRRAMDRGHTVTGEPHTTQEVLTDMGHFPAIVPAPHQQRCSARAR